MGTPIKTPLRCLRSKSTRILNKFSIRSLVLLLHTNSNQCIRRLLSRILFLERHGWGSQSRPQFLLVPTMYLDSFKRVFFPSFQWRISELMMAKMVLDPIATKQIMISFPNSEFLKTIMHQPILKVKLNHISTCISRDQSPRPTFWIEWPITFQLTLNLHLNSK